MWIEESLVLTIHGEQLAEHGGAEGLRDRGLLESALARPLNRAAYGEPDAAELAAAYGFGVARNPPFVDGNKRAAFVLTELFLVLNGYELVAEDADCLVAMLAVAAGDMDEAAFAGWIRSNVRAPLDAGSS